MVESVVAVDPDSAGLETVADVDGGVEVCGVYGGGKTNNKRLACGSWLRKFEIAYP